MTPLREWAARFLPDCPEEELVYWAVRFALPVRRHVVIAAAGDEELLGIEGEAVPLPDSTVDAPLGSDPAKLIHEVERLQAKGAKHLLLPKPAQEALERSDSLRSALGDRYRLVLAEPGVCTIFAIADEPWPREGKDGFPLPPPEVVHLTAGLYGYLDHFYDTGRQAARCLRDIATRHQVGLTEVGSLLDFGCGCGRVLRHWRRFEQISLAGSDYNPCLVDWAQQNLPFASYRTNGLTPGLDFEDEAFDLLYAISVFTHLPEPLQFGWMAELGRVLKPGAHMILTLHGKSRLPELTPTEVERFNEGALIVHETSLAGSNLCNAYHPESYVRNILARDFELLAFLEHGAPFANQDAVLIRKPG
jgi:SAM-dependent methyltransferase